MSAAQAAIFGIFFLLSACSTPDKSMEAEVSPVPPAVEAADADPSVPEVMILQASGGIETTYPPGRKLPGNASICLKDEEKITILAKTGTQNLSGPGCFPVDTEAEGSAGRRLSGFLSSRGSSRARTGAVRGAGSSSSPTPIADLGEVIVIRGSKSALKRFKRKSTILTGTKICLEAKESLTVLRKKGGMLNLKGPGCNVFQRSGEVINVAGVSAGN